MWLAAFLLGLANAAPPTVYTKSVDSPLYHIDKIYRSMRGPDKRQTVSLVESGEPELLWIVGYETTVVNDTGAEISQEFMCHANLDFDAREYYKKMSTRVPLSGRVFTLSQGQQRIDFPPGFGIPIRSDQDLFLTTQVLNLNLKRPKDLYVRHHVEIRYLRDSELDAPLRPLYQGAVQGFKSLTDSPGYYGLESDEVDPELHGEGCAVGQSAIDKDPNVDKRGGEFTAHWVVEPGREVNRTLVTHFLDLPFDTTAHYIAVHLHPFAESLELLDLTAEKTVFKSHVRGAEGRIGIEEIEYFTSETGVKLYADHEYELVSVYNNTTYHDQDSMAVMYLYLLDRKFRKGQSLRVEE